MIFTEINGNQIPTFENPKPGVNYLKEQIHGRLLIGSNVLVRCAGGSASGKTSQVSKKTRRAFFGRSSILSLDNYYKGIVFMQEEWAKANMINYDQPEALDLELARKHIMTLLGGERVPRLIYDFKTGLRAQKGWIEPAEVLIVEGLFALLDEFDNLTESDIRVFVEIGTHGRFVRRLLRDLERTSWVASEIIGYFARITEPMHQEYIEASKAKASVIINNEYRAEEECRSGIVSMHLKFRGALDSDLLWHLGAEQLGSFPQNDIYLSPLGNDISGNGELVRIRTNGFESTFSYIAPKETTGFRKRRKVGPLEISDETAKNFRTIYSNVLRSVQKTRKLYLLHEGVIVAVDLDVILDTNRKRKSLGPFTEIRFAGNVSEEKVHQVIEKLGFKIEDAITDSYAEMA